MNKYFIRNAIVHFINYIIYFSYEGIKITLNGKLGKGGIPALSDLFLSSSGFISFESRGFLDFGAICLSSEDFGDFFDDFDSDFDLEAE